MNKRITIQQIMDTPLIKKQLSHETYKNDLEDIEDHIGKISINEQIAVENIRELKISSREKAYLDKLLAEKGKRLASNIYRGSLDGFKLKDFHSRCDEKGPTVSLFKVK